MNMRGPLLSLIAACTVCGCVAEPMAPPPPPQPRLVPDTNVYFYPAAGRSVSADQQDRDKYECNSWAVQQSGFDPSNPQVPPHRRMRVVASGLPPGAAVGAGAVTGAVVGSAVSAPWESGRGALLGAVAGAAIGGVIASEHNQDVNRAQAQADANAAQVRTARVEREASDFRRALGACLEARGYSVK